MRATEDASAEAITGGWTADCLRALPLHDGLPFLPDRQRRMRSGSATLPYGTGTAWCATPPRQRIPVAGAARIRCAVHPIERRCYGYAPLRCFGAHLPVFRLGHARVSAAQSHRQFSIAWYSPCGRLTQQRVLKAAPSNQRQTPSIANRPLLQPRRPVW